MATSARLTQIEAMIADDPADTMLHYMLGMEHVSLGDDAAAVVVFRNIIGREPYVPAYHMAGQALARMNKLEESAAILKDGIEAARSVNDLHALGEMEALLATVD